MNKEILMKYGVHVSDSTVEKYKKILLTPAKVKPLTNFSYNNKLQTIK